MRRVPTPLIVPLAIAALIVIFLGWQSWRGPQVAGYVIEPVPLLQTVVGTGRVTTASRAQVGSEITAVVTERKVREGDTVEPGDLLLVLRADDIAAEVRQAEAALDELITTRRPQAAIDLKRAESELAQARRETARRQSLAERSQLSAEALEQAQEAERLAEAAADSARLAVAALAPGKAEERRLRERLSALRAQLAKTEVRSQVAGTVLTRNVDQGDLVQPGRVLFTIAMDGGMEIRVPLDERNLSRLTLGQNATAIADAYPDRPFPARVKFIAPSIDPQSGTVEVRLAVDPVPEFVRQDMTVSVTIKTGQREAALAVPNDALMSASGNQTEVFVVRDHHAHRVTVTLGLRGLAKSEVTAGLREGDRVLADTATVAEGDRVRFSPREAPASHAGGDTATRNESLMNFD